MRTRSTGIGLSAAVALSLALCSSDRVQARGATPAAASVYRVAVGQTLAADGNPAHALSLRRAIREAIHRAPGLELVPVQKASHVVGGTLTRFTRERGHVHCEVRLFVRSPRGALEVVLSSRRSLHGPSASLSAGSHETIAAAVSSALGPLRNTLVSKFTRS